MLRELTNQLNETLTRGWAVPEDMLQALVAHVESNRFVTKYGRPWMGSLEGWSITDLIGEFNSSVEQFMADEIWPTIDLWQQFHNYKNDVVQMPVPLVGQS